MPRSLGRYILASLAPGITYWLASVVIVVRMTVTPIPIRPLLLLSHFSERPIFSVSLPEVYAEGTVFVVIPIVIVLVVTVVEPIAVIVVTTVFFLSSVVLCPGRSADYRWRGKGRSKKNGTEKISISTVHVVFLLAQEFLLGNLGLQRVCCYHPGSDVR